VTGVSTAIALSAVLAAIVGSRLLELRRSGENERKLLARGGRRVPGDLFPALAALHSGFIVALLLEVWTAGTAPSAWWPFWLFLWASGEGLRVASIRALADEFVELPAARCERGEDSRWQLDKNPVRLGGCDQLESQFSQACGERLRLSIRMRRVPQPRSVPQHRGPLRARETHLR
jgi:hypothetical protein